MTIFSLSFFFKSLTLSPIELVAALLTADDKEEATAILFPPELPAPKTEEEEAEAMILAAAVLFALLEPCFCCLSENALLLSLEKRRLFRSGPDDGPAD